MPRKLEIQNFVELSYRHLSRKADSSAIRLKATDRLAVMYKLLTIPLSDPSKQGGHSPDVDVPQVPETDFDKIAEKMVEDLKRGNNDSVSKS